LAWVVSKKFGKHGTTTSSLETEQLEDGDPKNNPRNPQEDAWSASDSENEAHPCAEMNKNQLGETGKKTKPS
jgi:hypothetical protein